MDWDRLYDDEDDEFFFQSVSRYHTLQMFNLENIPQHLLPINGHSICVGSERRKGKNSEILKLKLPTKLTLPPEEEGRSKENDFKVLSGVYTENLLHQIEKLDETNKVIASENHISGLQIYSFSDSLLGTSINPQQKLNISVPWVKPNFTVIQERAHAICCKSINEPLVEVDILVGKKIREIKQPFCGLNDLPEIFLEETDALFNNIKCIALDSNLIAVLNTLNGCVVLLDLRTSNSFNCLPKSNENLSPEIWNLSGWDFKESTSNYFGLVSNKKSFCIYDKRNNSVVFQNTGDLVPKKGKQHMKLKINNKSNKFSISGMNSFVEIYEIQNGTFQNVFTHNGHCPKDLPSVVLTDHMWLLAGGNEYVISICNNGTLNCWEYKV